MNKVFNIIAVFAIMVVLFYGITVISDLPNNSFNELYTEFVEETLNETGAENVVSAIVLEFRSFDTLLESGILFLGFVFIKMIFIQGVD